MSTQTARSGVLGAAALGIDLADDAILGTVRDVHRAVGRRVTGSTGRVSGAVYAGVGIGLRAVASGLRTADRTVVGAGGRTLEDSPGGRFALSTLNGLFGDRITERHPELEIRLGLRRDGRDVAPRSDALAAAYPDATGDLVVFLSGLMETEDVWRRGADERGTTYADELSADGWTPLLVRANSGLTIARNGVELAGLLEAIVEAWPVPVRRIALVGHSMGGLVARTACVVETDAPEPWTRLVTDVVTLGTPHLGAPVAQALTAGSSLLSRLPESAPFGKLLDHRSAGILDLRGGLPRDVLALPHARYRLVAATLSRSPRNPMAEVAGDLLVGYRSAVARTRRGVEMFPGADVLHLPEAHHFDLLNHPDVAAALRRWLTH